MSEKLKCYICGEERDDIVIVDGRPASLSFRGVKELYEKEQKQKKEVKDNG
jgi:hypothetical protein